VFCEGTRERLTAYKESLIRSGYAAANPLIALFYARIRLLCGGGSLLEIFVAFESWNASWIGKDEERANTQSEEHSSQHSTCWK
jgi:hypothetical protein